MAYTPMIQEFGWGDAFEKVLDGVTQVHVAKAQANANGTEHKSKKLETERPSGAAVQVDATQGQVATSQHAPQPAQTVALLGGLNVPKQALYSLGAVVLGLVAYKAIK